MSKDWPETETVFNGAGDGRLARLLLVVAHPVDWVECCACTVLRLTERGVIVEVLAVTSGELETHASLVKVRADRVEIESCASAFAEHMGVSRMVFLGQREMDISEATLTLALVAEIRAYRPDVVATFDPTAVPLQHPDHRLVGRLVLDSLWPRASSELLHPELGPPHNTREAWLFGSPAPDLFVKVDPDLRSRVVAAVRRSGMRGADAVPEMEENFAQISFRYE